MDKYKEIFELLEEAFEKSFLGNIKIAIKKLREIETDELNEKRNKEKTK